MTGIGQIKKIRQELEDQSQNNWDVYTPQPKFWSRSLILTDLKVARLSDYALESLATIWDLPLGYLKKCPDDLLDINLNYWSRKFNEERGTKTDYSLLFRGHNDPAEKTKEVDAVLTNRYRPYDHVDVIRLIDEILEEANATEEDIITEVVSRSRRALHLRIYNRNIKQDISLKNVGDEVISGIAITNGETGEFAFSSSFLLYRLVCSNGLIIQKRKDILRHVHVSDVSEQRLNTIKVTIKKMIFEDREAFEEAVNLMIKGQTILFNPYNCDHCKSSKVMERLARILTSLDEAKQVIEGFEGKTVTDFVNHLTQAAHTYPFTQRLALEHFASRFLNEHVDMRRGGER